MLRAVLLGLLTLSAVACKSHDESQAKSQPGIAAGKVIEVTGTVTLHHGTDTRPLAKGDMVDADDVVETSADGSAVIEVQHNNVNWELGAAKKGTLRESLAWTAPKKDKTAKAVEEDSAAAGRHAERTAADNSATATLERGRADESAKNEVAMAPQAEAEGAAAPAAAPTPAAPPKPAAAPKPRAAAAPTKAAAPSPVTAAAPPPPVAQPVAPPTGGTESAAAPPPAPPPPPPKIIAKTAAPKSAPPSPKGMAPGGANADVDGLGLSGTGEGGGGAGTGSIGGGGLARPAPGPDASSLVKAKNPKLQACFKAGTSMRIKIEIDAAGKAKVLFIDKTDAARQTCVKKIIDGITFPKEQSVVTMAIKA